MKKVTSNGTGREVLIQIKQAMVEQGLSVTDLAKAIGEPTSTLYTRFQNPRKFTLKELLLINKALHMEGIVIS